MLSTPVYPPLVEARRGDAASAPRSVVASPPPVEVRTASRVLGGMRRVSIHGVEACGDSKESPSEVEVACGEQGGESLTLSAVQREWGGYLDKLRESQLGLYATLKDGVVCVLDDGCTVQFTFRTGIQEKTFGTIEAHVRGYFRYVFRRGDIDLRVVVDSNVEMDMAVCTREVYFERLLEENGALKALLEEYGGWLL